MMWRLVRAVFRRLMPGIYRNAVRRVAAENGLTPEQIERKLDRP